MKNCLLLICAISVIGCGAPKKPEIKDPCAGVSACFGDRGQSPSDVEGCLALIACRNWRMEAR